MLECPSLRGVYFQGNALSVDGDLFYEANSVALYHLPGTSWLSTFGGRTTALWTNPLLSTGSDGVKGKGFGCNISWAPNATLVVEACSDLASRAWSPIVTNTPSNGTWDFSDADWKTHPNRFYRVRSP